MCYTNKIDGLTDMILPMQKGDHSQIAGAICTAATIESDAQFGANSRGNTESKDGRKEQ